jgi:RNA-splicing ligase RtcB
MEPHRISDVVWELEPSVGMRVPVRIYAGVRGSVRDLTGANGMDLVFDVAHNLAKLEQHQVAGSARELCVHRKGATWVARLRPRAVVKG